MRKKVKFFQKGYCKYSSIFKEITRSLIIFPKFANQDIFVECFMFSWIFQFAVKKTTEFSVEKVLFS